MATGRVATVAPNATSLATIYTVPIGYYGIYNISITNTNATPVTIRLAVAAGATPNANEYIEYNATIVPQGVLERTGLVVGATQNLVAYASATGVSAVVYGIET